jgi:hypothetical protein
MDLVTIMRRADGKLFTVEVKGLEHLALWPSLESAMRYKQRNPQLLIFIPASVTSPFGQKSLIPLRKANLGLFLMMDAGGSHFGDGRPINWEELDNSLPGSPQPAGQGGGQAMPISSVWKTAGTDIRREKT